MGWVNGVFSRIHNWTDDRNNNIPILSSRHDAEDDNLTSGINNCLTKDGTNTPIVNIPMGGNRHTGCGAGVASDDYATIGQIFEIDGSSILQGNLNLGGNRATNAANGINSSDLVTKSQLDSVAGGITGNAIKDDGSTPMLANWDIGNVRITNIADGVGLDDVIKKEQAILRDGTSLMGGTLNMAGNRVINVADAINGNDAVTLNQLNNQTPPPPSVLQIKGKTIAEQSIQALSATAVEIGLFDKFNISITAKSTTSSFIVEFDWWGEVSTPLYAGFAFTHSVNGGANVRYVPGGASSNNWDVFATLPDKGTGDISNATYRIVYFNSVINVGDLITFRFTAQSTVGLGLSMYTNRTAATPGQAGNERLVSTITVTEAEL
jgi:hypothetical protein